MGHSYFCVPYFEVKVTVVFICGAELPRPCFSYEHLPCWCGTGDVTEDQMLLCY